MFKHWLYSFEFLIKTALLIFIVFHINGQVIKLNNIVIPVVKEQFVDEKAIEIKEDLMSLGAPKKNVVGLVKAIKLASDTTNINHKVITALMYTESNFRPSAVSEKNYKGLLQTTAASFVYSEVDTLLGAKELENKLRITDGNLLRALTLYKGGNNPAARRQASAVIEVYKRLLR